MGARRGAGLKAAGQRGPGIYNTALTPQEEGGHPPPRPPPSSPSNVDHQLVIRGQQGRPEGGGRKGVCNAHGNEPSRGRSLLHGTPPPPSCAIRPF